MSSRASADSATVRKGVAASSEPLVPHSVHVSLVPRAVKAIQAKRRKGKTAKKPPNNKPRYVTLQRWALFGPSYADSVYRSTPRVELVEETEGVSEEEEEEDSGSTSDEEEQEDPRDYCKGVHTNGAISVTSAE